MIDRHFSAELLKVISPLSVKASLAAADTPNSGEQDQDKALAAQLEQAEYEALRAFEQYDKWIRATGWWRANWSSAGIESSKRPTR